MWEVRKVRCISEVAMPWGSGAPCLQVIAARFVSTGLWLNPNSPVQHAHAVGMLKSSKGGVCVTGVSLTKLILKAMWHAALREPRPHVETAICICPQMRQDMLIQAASVKVAGIHHDQHGRISLQAIGHSVKGSNS